MGDSFITFTPVRRRQDTTPTWKTSTNDGKTWTTSRCNRLLRPLTSRVSALGRLLPSESLATEKSTSIHGPKLDNIQDEDSMREDDNDEDDDDEWAPVKKKLKRTYSARLGKGTLGRPSKVSKEKSSQGYSDVRQRMPFLVPGEICVSTPILNRTKGGKGHGIEFGISASLDGNLEGRRQKRPKSRHLTKDGEAHFELSEILRRLRRRTDASRYTLYEGIYNALESLLKATISDSESVMQERRGARSLFNTCLRKVPAVIKDEEATFALEAEERSAFEARDISCEIYAEFEALGYQNRGWKHLRSIVRAHGVQIIGDAITQGLVRPDFARALVFLCVHTACLDEAEMLISCLLKVTSCPEPKSIHSRTCDESSMLPLSVLEKFASYTGRRSFQARQLTGLLVTGQLPLAWLATKEFGGVWTHVIQSSASDADSTTFLTTLIPKLCSTGIKVVNFASTDSVMLRALDATFASILMALSAITLLDTSTNNFILQSATVALQQPGTVLRQCLITCAMLPSPLNNHRLSILVFSNLFINSELDIQDSFNDPNLFLKLSEMLSMKPTQKSNDSIASFICSVACCCGRGASTTGFDDLKLLHSRLSRYLENPACSSTQMIQEVIVDSAFSFAQRHDECEHLDYAEDIASEMRGKHALDLPRRLPTEAEVDRSAAFRWEEGISEWVTATPAFSLKKVANVKNSHVNNDINGDSPLRYYLGRGNRVAAPPMFTQVTQTGEKAKDGDRISAAHRRDSQYNQYISSDSEDDPLSISLASMASQDSSFTSFQSTEAEEGGRIKRPANPLPTPKIHGLRCRAKSQFFDDSDDELISSTASWDASIKRNRISVIILREDPPTKLCSHKYATRRKIIPSIPRKRVAADDDSADELCQ